LAASSAATRVCSRMRWHILPIFCVLSRVRRPSRPTLFPYTTLFRSSGGRYRGAVARARVRPHGLGPWARTRSPRPGAARDRAATDRKSTRLNSSHVEISYAVFCLKKKKKNPADKEGEHHAVPHCSNN